MIAELRADLAGVVAGADLGALHDTVPEDPIPPCVILQPAEPVLQEDPEAAGLGELLASFEVIALVELDDNDSATRELDGGLDRLAAALRGSDWWITGVGQPGAMHTSEWIHHGVTVRVQTRTTL